VRHLAPPEKEDETAIDDEDTDEDEGTTRQ